MASRQDSICHLLELIILIGTPFIDATFDEFIHIFNELGGNNKTKKAQSAREIERYKTAMFFF